MEIKNMKNMIVLKNLPSNIIEEAFVIIKPNMKIKEIKTVDNDKKNTNNIKLKNKKDYIVREAEMIVSSYISKINDKSEKIKEMRYERKYKKLKNINIFIGICFLLVIAINLLLKV